ncbi:Bypass of stop codon protein [Lachnellula suecica]|uniref:Bypass of stop codon protein n=1 Tax=Lachnellula suecica TaxID=602035 RepID=A0A8T9CLL7_9HELO|nr:Bypass of stop codon protein [Lachnellula suecica]
MASATHIVSDEDVVVESDNTSSTPDNAPKHIIENTNEKINEVQDFTSPIPLEQWNKPNINKYRYLASLYCFVIMGMNDAAYGALIPYLETFYDVNYTIISLIFLSPFVGYTFAAFLNNRIHMRLGQFGLATIAPTCKLIAYVVTCVHPPYPVLAIIFMLAGFGIGLEDGGFNAWVGAMENANELLGQAVTRSLWYSFSIWCFNVMLTWAPGVGGIISPLIATAMVTKGKLPWYTFYYMMTVLDFKIIALSTDLVKSNANNLFPSSVGVEVALGGWIVTFMLKVRHAEAFPSGLTATGFWAGITMADLFHLKSQNVTWLMELDRAGRVVLGFVTGKIGEKLAITVYLTICMALELCFWLIPNFVASAVFAGWLGFFLGPMFPAAIMQSVATKILPKRLHVSAIGFAAAFGGGGAAVFPFAVGAIAQAKGVQVLQPIVLAALAVILLLWCSLPGGFSKGGLEDANTEKNNSGRGRTTGGWIGKSFHRVRKVLRR